MLAFANYVCVYAGMIVRIYVFRIHTHQGRCQTQFEGLDLGVCIEFGRILLQFRFLR